jgi:hypothetical protein
MNRTGLVIALAVAATVGLVFGIRPDLDLELAALFFDPARGGFWRAYDPPYLRARDIAMWLVTLIAMPAFIALALKIIRPQRPPLVPGRAVLLMLLTLALAPGVVANMVFKGTGAARAPSTSPSSAATSTSARGGTRAAMPEELLLRRRRALGCVLDAWPRRR